MKRNETNAVATNACPSGKRTHPDRASAKRHAANVRRSNGEHLRPYRCPSCDLWHVGHLPDDVVRGIRSADEHYQRGTA